MYSSGVLLRWLMLAVALLVATQPNSQVPRGSERAADHVGAVRSSPSRVVWSTLRSGDAHRDLRRAFALDLVSPPHAPSLRPPSHYLRVATLAGTERAGFASVLGARSRAPPVS